jgi:hypothetical protein
MEPKASKKTNFRNNPSIDPITGDTIKIGSKKYKQLVEKYGEPNKIRSPKTNKLIGINKIEYKKLKKEGYTDNQLIMNEIKIFNIDGKNYTENELLMMINYYNSTHVTSIPNLNVDNIKEIMYHADINTLQQYCLTNTIANKLCNESSFWMEKFEKNNIPIIFEINEQNIKYMNDEDNEQKLLNIERVTKTPKTASQWIQAYKDSIKFISIATKFVENALLTNNFTEFNTPEIGVDECLWFSTKAFKHVYNLRKKLHNIVVNFINYKISKNKYEINLDIIDYDTDNITNYKIPLSKNEFILYLAKLIYFFRDYDEEELFLIENNKEELDVDALYINDLTEKLPTYNRKMVFPNWK